MKTSNIRDLMTGIVAVVLISIVAAVVTVAATAYLRYSDLVHGPAYTVAAQPVPMRPLATPETPAPPVDTAALEALAQDPRIGTLHGQVTDAANGQVLWQREAQTPLIPASSTKITTAAAAIVTLEPGHRITTEVVTGNKPGEIIIKAAGDVWLNEKKLDELAIQLQSTGATHVAIDTSVWSGPEFAPSVTPDNAPNGYIAPMQPAMINGARIGGASGDLPRSETPARDVASALASRLGAQVVPEPAAASSDQVLASVESPPLEVRIEDMLKWSDNVMAEAIAREVALARGEEASFAGAARATLSALQEYGFDISGARLSDNSGMSEENLLSPQLLDSIIQTAVSNETLRPLLGALPVAAGEGTLIQRYGNLPGRGLVRAKTGTLTGVNALVGTVVGQSGRLYTFALLSNGGPDILSVRQALDEFASVLAQS